MVEEYTKEQYWKLFNNLPEALQEAVLSPNTAEDIREICERNDIEEKIPQLAEIVGDVLMGVLRPEEIISTLKEQLEIKEKKAKQVEKEIILFIIHPVQRELEKLYEIKIETPSDKEIEKDKDKIKKDPYREKIK